MIVGRLVKDSAELRRVTIDFSLWLDATEQVSATTTPAIIVEQLATWQQGAWVSTPPPPVTDTTPLSLASSVIAAGGSQVMLMLGAGTPGLTYKVTFVATGGISGRQAQVDFTVTVRMPA